MDKNKTFTEDIVNRLQKIIYDRFKTEQPERTLTDAEMENIWYVLLGKLCRGETENDIEEYCKTVKLN